MPGLPPEEVLDLFAVPSVVQALPGGQGESVLAGDLVLSPGRRAQTQDWLSPLLARFAVGLDERPSRGPRDLRVAVPVPARDGSWVVQGWAASRYEPGTVVCRDLEVTLAAGRLLHARLAVAVPQRPAGLDAREDRWARAERRAFAGDAPPGEVGSALLRRVYAALAGVPARDADLGPPQLVHADLAGNVLLDADGAPVVIDVAPAWRPVRWAEAVCVLDSVLWLDGPATALAGWNAGTGTTAQRLAMLRAVAFRVLSDRSPDLAAYERVVDLVLG